MAEINENETKEIERLKQRIREEREKVIEYWNML